MDIESDKYAFAIKKPHNKAWESTSYLRVSERWVEEKRHSIQPRTPDDDATGKEDKGDEKSDVYLIYVLIGFD